jgi:ABC-type uncharacterized transport system permease subunit
MELESWVVSTIARSLAFSTPLLWAALGEIFAERAGVVNLGVEGMMILGAVSGFIVAQTTGSPLLGLLVAALVGGAAGLIHAFFSITLRANQYVSGLALTILGLGVAGLVGRAYVGIPLSTPMKTVTVPGLADIPILGPALFTNQHLLTYAGLVVAILLGVLLFTTRLGIAIRSAGESPAATDALGINVFALRYACVAFGGMMAGIGGAYLSLAYRPTWTDGMTAGMGWIALAIVIFAAWRPARAILAAFIFGACFHLAFRLQNIFPAEFLQMLRYLVTILSLTLIALGRGGRQAGAPAALGQPYTRGER